METIFINSENSRTFKPFILTLKLVNKLDLVKRLLLYQILAISTDICK